MVSHEEGSAVVTLNEELSDDILKKAVQCVGYDAKAWQTHGCRAKHRIELPAKHRDPDSGCQRNADNIIYECPKKIFMNVFQSGAA